LKYVLIAVAAIAGLAIAAMAVLPRIVDTRRVQSLIASTASHALARPVKFRAVSVSVLPYPALRLHGLDVAEDPAFGSGPFVHLDDADLKLKLWPLLRGQVEFATLVLRRPTISLVQNPDGRWNFATLGTARETASVPRVPRPGGAGGIPTSLISSVVIDQGLVTYELQRAAGVVRQRIEGVDATLSPRPGAVAFAGSARVMPGDLRVKIVQGTLGLSGARTLNDASVRARIEVDGGDVQPVLAAVIGPEPAIAGAVSARIDVAGTVGRPRAAGELELRSPVVTRTTAACAEPRRRSLALGTVKANLSWDDGRVVVQPLTTGIRNGSIATRVAGVPLATAQAELSDLVLTAIPLEPILVDFLCLGYAVTGSLDLTGTLTLSPADPMKTLSGGGRLHVGAGRVVGARALALLGGFARVGGTVSSALNLDVPGLVASPLEFESIAGTYQIHNGIVTTRDLAYTSRAMRAKMAGDYAIPTGRVNFDLVLEQGHGVFQAKVTGTADAPSIRVASSVLRAVDPGRVERGFKDLLEKFR
jgi:uncharacterized protein involved in outer membrane biogenesis